MATTRGGSTAALYCGGAIGPLGGGIISVLLPELADTFDASLSEVSAAIPAYLVPFALLQLVSGTIGERLGRERVIRAGYAVYAVMSVAAAFAGSLGLFLVLRALAGATNAFLSPLLLATVAEAAPPGRLGRSVGTFGAAQVFGTASAPLFGGLAGDVNWRWAFVVPAVVAAGLAVVPLPVRNRPPQAEPARMRALLDRRVAVLCVVAFLNFLCVAGLSFLVAIRAAEAFGLSSTWRGVLVAGFGVAGVGAGRYAGQLSDRHSPARLGWYATLACVPLVALLGVVGSVGLLAVVWAGLGISSTATWASLNTLTISAIPSNRAGAASVVACTKFLGSASAPLLWLPLYHDSAALAFAVPAAVTIGAAVVLRRY